MEGNCCDLIKMQMDAENLENPIFPERIQEVFTVTKVLSDVPATFNSRQMRQIKPKLFPERVTVEKVKI